MKLKLTSSAGDWTCVVRGGVGFIVHVAVLLTLATPLAAQAAAIPDEKIHVAVYDGQGVSASVSEVLKDLETDHTIHVERTAGLDSVIPAAVRWAAAKNVTESDPVVFQIGDLPVVISAPHGGNMKLAGVEPRTGEGLECGPAGFRVVRDGGTEELAMEVARQLAVRMNGKPSFVISRVHRRYVDFNRPAKIAVEAPLAQVIYDQYHQTLSESVRMIRSKHACGLLIDIHGQGTSASTVYRGTSNGLTVSGMKSMLSEESFSGPNSLCGLLKKQGWTMHPDPLDGKEQSGFTGGHIVRTYGSHQPDGIDAIQLEFGVDYRKAAVRQRVAKQLADSIAEYFEQLKSLELKNN